MRLGSYHLSLGPAASRGGATSRLGCPLTLCSQKLEGNFPGWQVNPGGSQRRHLWLSQKLQVPGLPTSVLLCLPPFPSLSGTPDWILALSNFVHYFNGLRLRNPPGESEARPWPCLPGFRRCPLPRLSLLMLMISFSLGIHPFKH